MLSSWFVGHWTPGTINFTVPDYPRLALSPAYASSVPLPVKNLSTDARLATGWRG